MSTMTADNAVKLISALRDLTAETGTITTRTQQKILRMLPDEDLLALLSPCSTAKKSSTSCQAKRRVKLRPWRCRMTPSNLNRSNFATKEAYVDANYADVLAFRTHRMFQQIADAHNEQRASEQQRELARRSLAFELRKLDREERKLDASEPVERQITLCTAADIKREETEGRDAKMLIDGLLPARGFNILVGDSGIGKSPLLLQAAACVASGTPFLGHPVRQGRVLIVDHENAGRLISTLEAVSRAIGKDFDADVAPHLKFLQSAEAAETFEALKNNTFALVVVDACAASRAGKRRTAL